MAQVYYDPVLGKEIPAEVPSGKFRVVGADTFERGGRGIFYGDFGTIEEARTEAVKVSKKGLAATIWNDKSQLVG